MDLLLLGAAAIVLVALTVWLVWRPADAPQADVRAEEANEMLPQGDRFEDQYTSATADLSAGGVAVTAAQSETPTPEASDFQRASEPWSEPSLAHEGLPASPEPVPVASVAAPGLPPNAATPMLPEPSLATRLTQPKTVSVGAAALLTLGGAIGGAWAYARWQKQRNKPVNRLRRTFR